MTNNAEMPGPDAPDDASPPSDLEGSVRPHHYWPSYQHMGDCAVCGHVAESPLHLPPERAPRRDLFDL